MTLTKTTNSSAAETAVSPHNPLSSVAGVSGAAHALLLLSDSSLPLSSFSYSSGLESYLVHHGYRSWSATGSWPAARKLGLLWPFLRLSIAAVGRSALPFCLAGHAEPGRLAALDDEFDAMTLCEVARRASTQQGRALLAVWERCLRGAGAEPAAAAELDSCAAQVRHGLHAHLAPLWGAVCRAAGLGQDQALYLYMLNHVKAVVSAAVRIGVCGPYKNWEILAGHEVRDLIARAIGDARVTPIHEAGQCAPLLDVWVGRHELLYSRIFNS